MLNSDETIIIEIKTVDGQYILSRRGDKDARRALLPIDDDELKKIRGLVTELAHDAEELKAEAPDLISESLGPASQIRQKLQNLVKEIVPAKLPAQTPLVLQFPDEWHAFPWELLQSKDNSPECLIVRQINVDSSDNRFDHKKRLPLSILGFSYTPKHNHVNPNVHWTKFEETLSTDPYLKELVQSPCILVGENLKKFLDQDTLPEEIKYLGGRQVDVVHILAHGSGLRNGNSYIDLGTQKITGEQLANKLSRLRPWLVILASCETAAVPDDHDRWSNVSTPLLQAGIPAVIAMQFKISPLAAEKFTSGLFQGLLKDNVPLLQAVQCGRGRISSEIPDTLEWATPVLYISRLDLLKFNPLTFNNDERRRREAYLRRLYPSSPALDLPVHVKPYAFVDSQPGEKTPATPLSSQAELEPRDAADVLRIQVQSTERRVTVLLGDTGSGKSAVLQELISKLINPDGIRLMATDPHTLIPVLVPIRKIPRHEVNYDLPRLVHRALVETWSVPRSFESSNDAQPAENASSPEDRIELPSLRQVESWTQDKAWRFLVILDGLEEVPPDRRPDVSKMLKSLTEAHRRHHYIFTSNPTAFVHYGFDTSQYSIWQIIPLDQEIVSQELDKVGRHLDDFPQFGDLLTQPWALITLKKMSVQGQDPSDLANLLRGRIDQWVTKANILHYQRRRTSETLTQLAWKMHTGYALRVDELFKVMKEVRGERTYDLEQLFERFLDSGLLSLDVEDHTEMVRVRDPYIHAILVASAVNETLEQDTARLSSFVADFDINNPHHDMVLKLLCQLKIENATIFFEALEKRLKQLDVKSDDWPQLVNLLVYFLQQKPEGVNMEDAPKILKEKANDQDMSTRVRRIAAEALGDLGKVDEAENILRTLLEKTEKESNLGEGVEVARVLGKLNRARTRAMGFLLKVAHSQDPSSRSAILSWVDLAQNEDLLEVVNKKTENIEQRKETENVDLRTVATTALGDRGRVEDLLHLVKDGQVPLPVYIAAVEALANLGQLDELLRLVRLEGNEKLKDDMGRVVIAVVLIRFNRIDPADGILQKEFVNQQSEEVRLVAAEALASLGLTHLTYPNLTARGISILMDFARNTKAHEENGKFTGEKDYRKAAVEVLGKLGSIKELSDLATDKEVSPPIRVAAVVVLKEKNPDLAKKDISILMGEGNPDLLLAIARSDKKVNACIRAEAVSKLFNTKYADDAASYLLSWAHDITSSSSPFSQCSVEILRKLVDKILDLTQDKEEEPHIRVQAVETLVAPNTQKIFDSQNDKKERALEVLQELVSSQEEDKEVQAAALMVLWKIDKMVLWKIDKLATIRSFWRRMFPPSVR